MVFRSPHSSRRARKICGNGFSPSAWPALPGRPLPGSFGNHVNRVIHQPLTQSSALDPYEEIARQNAIHQAAVVVVNDMREALMALARTSNDHACRVACEQEDWPQRIEDCLSDLMEDSFACLPDAIARARRELGREE